MKKKLLTIDDLVQFCASNNVFNFSADESGYQIRVQVPSLYSKDENKSNESTLFGKVKLLHTNLNRNGSNVTKEAAKNCLSSIAYKPLLANFCEIDGVKDFTSHDMEFNEDGTVNYLEHQIGCFTATAPYMEYDSENDRDYIFAEVAIPREYTAAAEIIERKDGTKISAELAVNKMSYDAEKHELMLEDIEVMGATCLGKNPETGEDILEGMEGARLDIADFSAENNSVKFEQNEKLVEVLEKLNTTLSAFNIQADDSANTTEEGGKKLVKFEELLQQYNKTVEDITFEYENLSDDELEAAFAEAFAEANSDGDSDPEGDENPDMINNSAEDEGSNDENSDDEPEGNEEAEFSVKYSLTYGDNIKEFSVSLNDKIYALQELVNETYADDGDWYSVEVFEDTGYVYMHGWMKSYRQEFKCKKKKYSLVGDRCEVFSRWMTQDEIDAFDRMRGDFEALQTNFNETSTKLANYESEPDKMNILNSPDYAQIADSKEFIALKDQSTHFELSVDEVQSKADELLLAFAKSGKLEFEAQPESGIKNMPLPEKNKNSKKSRYGNLFKKED